jgi:hypothetical protein
LSIFLITIPKLQHTPIPLKCCEPENVPQFRLLLLSLSLDLKWVHRGAWGCVTFGFPNVAQHEKFKRFSYFGFIGSFHLWFLNYINWFFGLAYQGKDIVFRFVTKYNSLRDFDKLASQIWWYPFFQHWGQYKAIKFSIYYYFGQIEKFFLFQPWLLL